MGGRLSLDGSPEGSHHRKVFAGNPCCSCSARTKIRHSVRIRHHHGDTVGYSLYRVAESYEGVVEGGSPIHSTVLKIQRLGRKRIFALETAATA